MKETAGYFCVVIGSGFIGVNVPGMAPVAFVVIIVASIVFFWQPLMGSDEAGGLLISAEERARLNAELDQMVNENSLEGTRPSRYGPVTDEDNENYIEHMKPWAHDNVSFTDDNQVHHIKTVVDMFDNEVVVDDYYI